VTGLPGVTRDVTGAMRRLGREPGSATSGPFGYPNGRAMTDDTFSLRFAWMSDGKIPPQGLKPHDDLLAEFPYLGPPNVYPV
jgi:hypothetical protein